MCNTIIPSIDLRTIARCAAVVGLMEMFGNAREVYQHARKNFNFLVMVHDINGLGRKFRLKDDQYDVVRVKDLLYGEGILGLLKREDIVNFAFFVPGGVRPLVGISCNVLPADATLS